VPLAAATPRRECILSTADTLYCGAVTDNFGLTAKPSSVIHGPVYVQTANDTDAVQGFSLLGADGQPLATYSDEGVYWRNAAGVYTHHLDTAGNLFCRFPVVGMVASIALEKTTGTQESARGIVKSTSIKSRITFYGSDNTYPTWQMSNTLGACCAKFLQDGTVELLGLVVPNALGANPTFYRSFNY
jgi:hypothetical protein